MTSIDISIRFACWEVTKKLSLALVLSAMCTLVNRNSDCPHWLMCIWTMFETRLHHTATVSLSLPLQAPISSDVVTNTLVLCVLLRHTFMISPPFQITITKFKKYLHVLFTSFICIQAILGAFACFPAQNPPLPIIPIPIFSPVISVRTYLGR
ncbi:hypothetical protein M378DRAFT_944367 [Amanita muscaria Koide BX008]|uniref:Uncharacterized protein n=1 Tax=Amanita muscaria (strain Koide BX008) TaxID=946122 RepID=A0A0C2X297_AMAMK|nr:hypothetical protein M378DRAFT_944367 [Amanita muscaria Koide BX008]